MKLTRKTALTCSAFYNIFLFLSVIAVSVFVIMRVSSAKTGVITIRTNYTRVETGAYPKAGVSRSPTSATINLYSDGSIETVSYRGGHELRDRLRVGVTGKSVSFTGRPASKKISIVNGAIVISSYYENFVTVSTLNTNKIDSCDFSVSFSLLPGETLYNQHDINTGNPFYASDIRAEDASCSIETP